MSLYTEIQADVFYWTKRKLMVNETDMAIRQAIRKAHRAGSFPRDMTTVTLTGQSTSTAIQSIDMAANLPSLRQLYHVAPTGIPNVKYEDADIRDLVDQDGYPKTNVFWTVGTTLFIRAASPSDSIDVTYYKLVNVDNLAALDDWIATQHKDLIVLWAAATILTMVGEQEVKTRVEDLTKLAYADLIGDSVEAIGR